jgi:hypothetical protein
VLDGGVAGGTVGQLRLASGDAPFRQVYTASDRVVGVQISPS